MNILIFEDEFLDDENSRFINRIKIVHPEIHIHKANSVKIFEKIANRQQVDMAMLDIMGAETDVFNHVNGNRVSENLLGIEILSRIRSGYYSKIDSMITVIIRSARADEVRIRRHCMSLCTEHVYLPGKDDQKIIAVLGEVYQGTKYI